MEKQINHNSINTNHDIIMFLCCLIPLIITGILLYLGFKQYAILLTMLLCPLLHYVHKLKQHHLWCGRR